VLQLVRDIAAVMQEFTQSGGVRPFGVSLLIAGCVPRGSSARQRCRADWAMRRPHKSAVAAPYLWRLLTEAVPTLG
jgi:hypothetical protein